MTQGCPETSPPQAPCFCCALGCWLQSGCQGATNGVPTRRGGFQEPTIWLFRDHGALCAQDMKHPLNRREYHSPTGTPTKSTSEPPTFLGFLLLQPPHLKEGPSPGSQVPRIVPTVCLHHADPQACARLHHFSFPLPAFIKPLTHFLSFIHSFNKTLLEHLLCAKRCVRH